MFRNSAELAGAVWLAGGILLLVRAVPALAESAGDERGGPALTLFLGALGAFLGGVLVLGLLWRAVRRHAARLHALPLHARSLLRALARPSIWAPALLGVVALVFPALQEHLGNTLELTALGGGVLALGLGLAHLMPMRPSRSAAPAEIETGARPRRGVLLLDAEEPEAPRARAVRRHLRRVLGDRLTQPRRSLWKALWCRNVVAPWRARKLAREYRRVWTAEGGPRTCADARVARALAAGLGPGWRVAVAGPREGGGLGEAIDGLLAAGCEEIRVVPLLPQYSVAATGARIAELHRRLAHRRLQPALRIQTHLYRSPGFIRALAEPVQELLAAASWDQVVFAFPGRTVALAADPFAAQCRATAKALAHELDLAPDRWSLAFGDGPDATGPEPHLYGVLLALAPKAGRVLLVPAGITTDGVETLHGMGVELAAEFQRAGGRELRVVSALNDHPTWIRCLVEHVLGEADAAVVRHAAPEREPASVESR